MGMCFGTIWASLSLLSASQKAHKQRVQPRFLFCLMDQLAVAQAAQGYA